MKTFGSVSLIFSQMMLVHRIRSSCPFLDFGCFCNCYLHIIVYVQIDAEGKVPRNFLGKVSVTNSISKKSDFNGSNTDSPSLEIDEEEYHQTQSTNSQHYLFINVA